MRSYDDMLDEMIMSTRVEDMSKREREDEGLSLNEILNKFKITKWKDKDGKNWFTIGESPNIIDASFKALIDSLDYKLFKDNAPASK